jgi:UDP-glucose 4-epimerase
MQLITNLNSFRDFIHIEDLCDAINLLISKRAKGIFNIGSGKKTGVLEIAKLISKLSNKKNIKYDTYENNDKKDCYLANISKIKRLGWKPKKNIYKILKDFVKKKNEFKKKNYS